MSLTLINSLVSFLLFLMLVSQIIVTIYTKFNYHPPISCASYFLTTDCYGMKLTNELLCVNRIAGFDVFNVFCFNVLIECFIGSVEWNIGIFFLLYQDKLINFYLFFSHNPHKWNFSVIYGFNEFLGISICCCSKFQTWQKLTVIFQLIECTWKFWISPLFHHPLNRNNTTWKTIRCAFIPSQYEEIFISLCNL